MPPSLPVTWALWEPPINQLVTHQDHKDTSHKIFNEIMMTGIFCLWWWCHCPAPLTIVNCISNSADSVYMSHVTCHNMPPIIRLQECWVKTWCSSCVMTGDAVDAAPQCKCKCKLILWDDRLAGWQDGSQLLFHSKLMSITYLPQQYSLDMTHHPSIQCMGILLIQDSWSSTQSLHDIFVNQNGAYSVWYHPAQPLQTVLSVPNPSTPPILVNNGPWVMNIANHKYTASQHSQFWSPSIHLIFHIFICMDVLIVCLL